jgi:DNA-binding phage protein
MAKTKTGFDKYLARRMEQPEFAEAFEQAHARIAGIDSLIRAIEHVLGAKGMSKAELARRIGAKPESVRRLLSDPRGNPTLSTILKVLNEVGLHLEVAPNAPRRRKAHEARAGA